MQKDWWKTSVAYQIYIRSFYDSDGDGMGDLRGIIEKLDYLKTLGINAIWITPFYPSPLDDNGYDISDFMAVDPSLGTLEEAKELIEKAHSLGIKVLLDYVMNQTSDEHPWFIESKSSVDNPKRSYYLWAPGRVNPAGERVEPNNWGAFFGGPAWNYSPETDQYYMKIFSDKMPDINWDYEPLRKEMAQVARFWLDLGVDGFRMDAIAHLGRDLSFKNSKLAGPWELAYDWSKFSNRDVLYDYLHELHKDVFQHYNVLTIGEVGGGAKLPDALKYVNKERPAIDMVFNFDTVWCNGLENRTILKPEKIKVNVAELRKRLVYWLKGSIEAGIAFPMYWTNHDHPRALSQYGDINFHQVSGRLLAMVLLSLPGMIFIYNGEEIGMTNVDYQSLEDFKDASSRNFIRDHKHKYTSEQIMTHLRYAGRDNGHLPFQWSNTKYGGFSTSEPYLKMNDNYQWINAEDQMNDQQSIWSMYREMIQLRLESDYSSILTQGNFDVLDHQHPDVFVFVRRYENHEIITLANFRDHYVQYPIMSGKVLQSNYETYDHKGLQPYEGRLIWREYDEKNS